MNKRLLSMSMIVPLAAAGAVATAPAASADYTSVKCTLEKAWSNYDKINLKLKVESHGSQGDWFKVLIYQWYGGHYRIIEKKNWYHDYNGYFNIYDWADNKNGPDYFKAYVYNYYTHDYDWCYKTVY